MGQAKLTFTGKESGGASADVPYYTVTFDTGGGSPIPEQIVKPGGYAVQPIESPTKSGYSFDGWMYNGSLFLFGKTAINSDITLTAEWL